MDKIIGGCGIICSECDAYIATKSNDDEKRAQTAANWSQMFNADIKPEDINCLGCNSQVLFSHCNECDIRACSTGKELSNCSECSDYSCNRLNEFFKMVPDSKTTLDSLR
jgi:hypothetical protein